MRGRGGFLAIACGLLLGLTVTPCTRIVTAAEPIANDFLGNVYSDGSNAPSGVPVSAEVNGVIYGTTSTLNVGFTTTYIMSTEGDDDATAEKDGIVTGDLMTFWVDGRLCDETYNNWQAGQEILGVPIPTLTNLDLHYSTAGQPAMLKINEVMPAPSAGNDWVEVYNPTGQPVDLGDYRIEDDDGFTLTLGGTIVPYGFHVVDLGSTSVLADSSNDEVKIAWRDPSGVKAGGQWVAVDRMEYGPASSGPDDTAPSGGDMGNAQLPQTGVSLELNPDGVETNRPNVDYQLSSRPDDTGGYTNTEVQPYITITSPASGVLNANLNFTIEWSDDDPDDNADIALFYDEDTAPGGESPIVDLPSMEDSDGPGDQYLWNTSSVPAGLYYVKAEIDDRTTPPMTTYSQGRVAILHPPSITVTEPDGIGDTADESFTVRWTDSDGDDNATIVLWWDTDAVPGGEGLIAQVPWAEDPDGVFDQFIWHLDSMPEGTYYAKAVISDGKQIMEAYSPGAVTIVHPPSIQMLQPDGIDDQSHRSYTIQWIDRDADDNATVTLYYDADNVVGGETLIGRVPWGEDPDGPFDFYLWNTTLVPEGYYYIKGEIDDGKNTSYSYSAGTVRVVPNEKPQITIIEPAGQREAEVTFIISWIDSDPDDDAIILLYYDTDTLPGGEVFIALVLQGEDSSNDSFFWSVLTVPEGVYYIKANISDGFSLATDCSSGFVHVIHPAHAEDTQVGDSSWILWLGAAVVVIIVLFLFFYMRKRRRRRTETGEPENGDNGSGSEEEKEQAEEDSAEDSRPSTSRRKST